MVERGLWWAWFSWWRPTSVGQVELLEFVDRWAYLSWWRRTGGGQVELVELVEASRQGPPPPPPMVAQRPLAPPPFQNPSLASLTSLACLAHFCQVLGDILTLIKTTRS